MARWAPGAAERLQRRAIELFTEYGFDQVTAAQIAQGAGLTERTFFRYFADKRDVIFGGQGAFTAAFLSGLAAAPPSAPPIDLMAAALEMASALFPDERRDYARARNAIIAETPQLRERERQKSADLAEVLGEAMRGRGIAEPTATLAAESTVTVFGIAFGQWLHDSRHRSLATISTGVLRALRALTAE